MPTVVDGRHIDQFIPRDLRGMFYHNPHPSNKYRIVDGYDPYGFSTDGLVLYLPLWALKDSAFKSIDAYRHSCTVTGASWRPYGREFDLTDDNIKINVPSWSFTSLSILIWCKRPAHDDTTFHDAIGWGWDVSPYGVGVYFRDTTDEYNFKFTNTAVASVATARAFTPDTWNLLSKTWDGTTAYDGINGTNYTGEAFSGTITPPTTLYLGRRTGGENWFGGDIGEVWVYNRALTATEILHIYNTTNWRYS